MSLSWFRGSVLEEVLIPYTLPGLLVVTAFIMVVKTGPSDSMLSKTLLIDGHGWTPIMALFLYWPMSIGIGALLNAAAHFVCDRLLRTIKVDIFWNRWVDWLDRRRGQKAGPDRNKAVASNMKAADAAATYRLRYSRVYLWAQFNLGMILAVPITSLMLRDYFTDTVGYNGWVLLAIAVIMVLGSYGKWLSSMRTWEGFEGLAANGKTDSDPN